VALGPENAPAAHHSQDDTRPLAKVPLVQLEHTEVFPSEKYPSEQFVQAVTPPNEYVPMLHLTHTVTSVVFRKLPNGQSSQVLLFARVNWPDAHLVHVLALLGENDAGGHAEQFCAWLREKVPTSQSEQTALLGWSAYAPGSHGVHSLAWAPEEYVPTPHSVQLVASNHENVPCVHSSHTVAPSFPVNCPGRQEMQVQGCAQKHMLCQYNPRGQTQGVY
jgi:hypothetical protein